MQVWLRCGFAPLKSAPSMRWLAALVLLSLALAGAVVPLCPADADACAASTDVLGAQTLADDDALDDSPSMLTEPALAIGAAASAVPEPAPARHTPLLNDRRRYRPPRA